MNKVNLQLALIKALEGLVAAYRALLAAKQEPPKDLLPLVALKADQLISRMAKLGYPIRVVEGFRTFERQDELYAQGRNGDTRPKVTNAKAGESLHNYGVAFDIVFRKEGYDGPWDLVGKEGEALGLEWGGRWTELVDKPHFQLMFGYTLKDFQNNKVDYSKYK